VKVSIGKPIKSASVLLVAPFMSSITMIYHLLGIAEVFAKWVVHCYCWQGLQNTSMSSVLFTDWRLHQWSINLDLFSYCAAINFVGHIIPKESSKRGPWNTELLPWAYRVCLVYNAIVYSCYSVFRFF
jgi:hypothetical protein